MIKVENDALILIDDNTVVEEVAKVFAIKQQMAHCDENFLSMKAAIEGDNGCSEDKLAKLDDTDGKIFIWISFAEIYNENVFDLLADDQNFLKKRSMKVLSNDGNAYIKGLTALFAKSSEDAYSILQYGMKNATYGSTDVNINSRYYTFHLNYVPNRAIVDLKNSNDFLKNRSCAQIFCVLIFFLLSFSCSRSHCIFFVTVISYQIHQEITWVTYKFCDLAGSERLKKTGNMGNRLKEAQRINTSLMVLGRCLDTVHKNQRQKNNVEFVPFRESKLTMLLQSALLGKEKLTMIVNLLPIEAFFEENINVLNFSSIAKQIVVQKQVPKQKNRRSSQFSFFMAQATHSPSTIRAVNERYEAEIEK
jgi:kinesin family member 20